jgi:hypothetical protein
VGHFSFHLFAYFFDILRTDKENTMYQEILKDLESLYSQAYKDSNISTALSIKKLELSIRERMKEIDERKRACKIPPLSELSTEDILFFLRENGAA